MCGRGSCGASERRRCLDGITDAMSMNLGKLWEMVKDRVPMQEIQAQSLVWNDSTGPGAAKLMTHNY